MRRVSYDSHNTRVIDSPYSIHGLVFTDCVLSAVRSGHLNIVQMKAAANCMREKWISRMRAMNRWHH
jgi:hypothetical protein